ncbi:lytic transglycosylase domain-containing protein [Aliirhizobium smilacinae]|uniref:lytic transglycosylase domain-containing protein n=1 Tax=Aliirhizobium smilacinae TaxID=1395944 RepID=UPI001FEA34A6|nr:lytic transglycosylase domain-containing protein [Rhizobium smilacinae]
MASLTFAVPETGGAQIAVLDASVLSEDSHRSSAAGSIAESDERRFSVDKGVTCAHYRPGRAGDAASAASANPQILARARQIARQEGVDEQLFLALIYQESRFNACATSPAGAIGLTQLMPATAAELGVNPHDIDDNLRGGARYLKQQLANFGGDTKLALAAYNAGPGNVQKYGGIPPFRETQGYVASITQRWLPAFGGESATGVPVATGGDGSAYLNFRQATLSSMASTQATTEGSGEVAQYWNVLGAASPGTLQDSWDHNSLSRNANLEMINRMIVLGATMANLIQAKQTMVLSGLSGSAQATKGNSAPREDSGQQDDACVDEERQTAVTKDDCRAALMGDGPTQVMLSLQ